MGNANSGRRERFFLSALLMELKSAGKDMPQLRNIARQLIAQAEGGDLQAIKEFIDRLDGKPMQAIEHSGEIETTSKEQREAAVAAALLAMKDEDERARIH